MSHGHPSQEGEHAAHHAQDPFDRKVAMSMVVIAAVLACVKILGHRTHNDTLASQIKEGAAHTQESDQWNFFQSKKMREVLARFEASLLTQDATRGANKEGKGGEVDDKFWEERREKLLKDFEEIRKPPKEPEEVEDGKAAREIISKSKKRLEQLTKQGATPDQAKRIVLAEMTAERYWTESQIIAVKAHEKKEEAHKYHHEGHATHKKANFFDLGELFVELALVLSSVAILTKRHEYWYGGLGVGALGVLVVLIGFFVH